ncbi:MAG: hypothetical protein QMD61_04150 [Methanobacterium sp.]|nr:hypothetical protein [Methanobacterium sp.]
MTNKKQSGALGKGLDALIGKNYIKETNKEEKITESEDVLRSRVMDPEIIAAILDDVKKNPRISLWSAKSAAVLRFLRKTEPEFSISSEASLLIEDAIKIKYPEIWDLFEEHF